MCQVPKSVVFVWPQSTKEKLSVAKNSIYGSEKQVGGKLDSSCCRSDQRIHRIIGWISLPICLQDQQFSVIPKSEIWRYFHKGNLNSKSHSSPEPSLNWNKAHTVHEFLKVYSMHSWMWRVVCSIKCHCGTATMHQVDIWGFLLTVCMC